MLAKTALGQALGNGGLTFTELGFGAAPLGNLFRAITDDEAQAVLEAAWAGGVRYFDTAPLYGLGLSETRLNRLPARQAARRLCDLHQGRAAAEGGPAGQGDGAGKVDRRALAPRSLRLQL
jgi:D-threo-aldose 1-dehydrogenase